MRTLRLVFIIPFCLISSNVAIAKPTINTYNLTFRFDFSEGKLFGKAVLSLDNVKRNDTLNLLLYRLLKVKSIKDNEGNEINFDQRITSFSDWEALQVNAITVFVSENMSHKTGTTIIVEYEGYLLGYTETGMSYVKDNIDPTFTILRMDCFAYPVEGIPNWKANRSAGLSYFDYTISATVPDTLFVANGGQLLSENKNHGSIEFVYHNLKPSWRIDVAIGKYTTLVDNGFSIYYFTEDSTGARIVDMSVKKVFSLYHSWFGDIPFSGYSIIEIPDGWGSQTDVTCIIQSASAFKDENRLYELYHEMSHIWNVQSIDKIPCRLESEGLAMFLQSLVTEIIDNEAGALDSSAARIFKNLQRRFATDSIASNVAIKDYGWKQMTDLSYTKGMLFFYLLYKSVGEDVFMKTIRDYYRVYRNKGATIEEFANFLIIKIHSKHIERLVNDWIYTNKSSQFIMNAKSLQAIVD